MKAFASYSHVDSQYVLQVLSFLHRHFSVYAFELDPHADVDMVSWVNRSLRDSQIGLIFVGAKYTGEGQQAIEVQTMASQLASCGRQIVIIGLDVTHPSELPESFPCQLHTYGFVGALSSTTNTRIPAERCAENIVRLLKDEDGEALPWQTSDGLPSNPHLFSYEKHVVDYFERQEAISRGEAMGPRNETWKEDKRRLADGCPVRWPQVTDLTTGSWDIELRPNRLIPDIGEHRARDACVSVAALIGGDQASRFSLPEAGPREQLAYPMRDGTVRAGLLVSGGIAPGINAVIDGIVQRHFKYATRCNHQVNILGYENGLRGLLDNRYHTLLPDHKHIDRRDVQPIFTSEAANRGGSLLGTYRMAALLDEDERHVRLEQIVAKLDDTDILYMIGGDGTMKAAHALWNYAFSRLLDGGRKQPLSIVAIPKTMDNDVLWVWQSFGFMSAVGRAHEFLEHLHTEVRSNPRVCVVQLFGSDSGFIVNHAVLACASGHCDLALIPEAPFSLLGIARHLTAVIEARADPIPRALVAMAETAIPVEVAWYLDPTLPLPSRLGSEDRAAVEAVRRALCVNDLARSPLSSDEVEAIRLFDANRRQGMRIQGQTSDDLRRAGMKVVLHGLEAILRLKPDGLVHWRRLRTLANEPRHLLRAIPPSPSDIVMGQRLGALAVDNAMAGYTDFMISQWLTEYVLVPLPLVALGRKRVPQSGVFWKSVLAKTGQAPDLQAPWADDSTP